MSEFKELLSLSTDQSVGESVSWSVKMSESIIHYATSKTPQRNHASLALYRHSDSNPSCQSGTSEFGVQTCLKATCQHSVWLINPEKNQEYQRQGMGSKSLKFNSQNLVGRSVSTSVSQSVCPQVSRSVSWSFSRSEGRLDWSISQLVGNQPACRTFRQINNQ